MTVPTIRVGIIGAGGNTRLKHIPGLQAQRDVEVAMVVNRTHESGAAVAREFGIAEVADTWEDIIFDDDIDAVCIGTWPYMHAPLTIAALEAGKHVLCEARMAMNAQEAQAMLDASRMTPGCVAQIVTAPMTLAFDRTIIDMISEGFIGNLISIDARLADGATFPNYEAPIHWRQNRDLSGNNIMAMGIWYECFMRWIGPASSVQALGQTVVKHRCDETGRRHAISIPDHIEIFCEMEQGGQMRLAMSSVVGHTPGVEIFVCGTEGTLRLANDTGELALQAGRRGQKSLKRITIPKNKRGGWRVEEEFINAIRGQETVTHTDFATALKYMEWTDAVTCAARTGVRVHLPLHGSIVHL